MTGSDLHRVPFERDAVSVWTEADPRRSNWPVVYTIDGPRRIYVGETTQVGTRIRQHLRTKSRQDFVNVRVLVDDTFNKSVCLDLESYLIRMFSGDGRFEVANANVGLTESDYFDRSSYRARFEEIFDQLRADGLFSASAVQIENGDLFKLSPFKALVPDQREAVLSIVEALLADLRTGERSVSVVQGGPGTGKTVVAIYLLKLLTDLGAGLEPADDESGDILSGLFTAENAALLDSLRLGLVVPQQSLRKTVQRVFRKTPGLHPSMVLSPFDVGQSAEEFDLLVVDEAHRLQQLSATMATLITKFKAINTRLFGTETAGDQLDWMTSASAHVLLMLDTDQTVRPADIPAARLREVQRHAESEARLHPLASQMRVRAGEDYVGLVAALLSDDPPPAPQTFDEYEFEFFDDLGRMRERVEEREAQVGLARLLAGYAWPWLSKNDPNATDIELDGVGLQWNRTATDWINSPTSAQEVGSVHTVQGYDLNYAGVIIGPDLRWDETRGLHVDRSSYHDRKGKANNRMLGITYDDEDLLGYITNIYRVLLTRAVRGTFVYVCDPGLREHLRRLVPADTGGPAADMAWRTDGSGRYDEAGDAPAVAGTADGRVGE